jgi:hypothetical protein
MLVRNLDQERGLVNGSRGVVLDFVADTMEEGEQRWPSVRFCNGLTVLLRPDEWEIEQQGRNPYSITPL